MCIFLLADVAHEHERMRKKTCRVGQQEAQIGDNRTRGEVPSLAKTAKIAKKLREIAKTFSNMHLRE